MRLKQFSTILVSAVILVFLLVFIFSVQGFVVASPDTSANVPITADAYIDVNYPNTTHNGGLLYSASSAGIGTDPDTITKKIYIKLDLSTINFPIAKAGLGMTTIVCELPATVDAITDMEIYGVADDSWTAASLKAVDAPPPVTGVLQTMTPSGITQGSSARYYWKDETNGSFAQWLESQRSANGGNNIATIIVQIQPGDGNVGVRFEDQEGSAATFGCSDADGALPLFRVSTADDPLPVRLTAFDAAPPSLNWLLIAALVALAAVVVGGVTYGVRRFNA